MPLNKAGKYNRVNPSEHTNHDAGKYHDGHGPIGASTEGKGGMSKPMAGKSANVEERPVAQAGQPSLPQSVVLKGGSHTTDGNPSYSPIGSATAEHVKNKSKK